MEKTALLMLRSQTLHPCLAVTAVVSQMPTGPFLLGTTSSVDAILSKAVWEEVSQTLRGSRLAVAVPPGEPSLICWEGTVAPDFIQKK